jgi:hypothetical protein
MTERGTVQERLSQLIEMKRTRVFQDFTKKYRKKETNLDMTHIKKKSFKEGDLVLLYEKKYFQHPRKFRMHFLGPYEVKTITDWGFVQIKDLGGTKVEGIINDSRLKLYKGSRPTNP